MTGSSDRASASRSVLLPGDRNEVPGSGRGKWIGLALVVLVVAAGGALFVWTPSGMSELSLPGPLDRLTASEGEAPARITVGPGTDRDTVPTEVARYRAAADSVSALVWRYRQVRSRYAEGAAGCGRLGRTLSALERAGQRLRSAYSSAENRLVTRRQAKHRALVKETEAASEDFRATECAGP